MCHISVRFTAPLHTEKPTEIGDLEPRPGSGSRNPAHVHQRLRATVGLLLHLVLRGSRGSAAVRCVLRTTHRDRTAFRLGAVAVLRHTAFRGIRAEDRKSTRLNSSQVSISND